MADDAPLPPRMVTTNPPVVLLEVRTVVAMTTCPICGRETEPLHAHLTAGEYVLVAEDALARMAVAWRSAPDLLVAAHERGEQS